MRRPLDRSARSRMLTLVPQCLSQGLLIAKAPDTRDTNAEQLPFNGSHGGVLDCRRAGIDGGPDRDAAGCADGPRLTTHTCRRHRRRMGSPPARCRPSRRRRPRLAANGKAPASQAGREHNAKRARRAERRGAAHGKAADRVDQLVDGAQTENAEIGRQRGLVNDRDRVAVPVDGPANEPTLTLG
jgi:hypothetical protein